MLQDILCHQFCGKISWSVCPWHSYPIDLESILEELLLLRGCVHVEGMKTDGPDTRGMYYKPMTIVNDDFRVVNKLEAPHTDATRVSNGKKLFFYLRVCSSNT